MKSMAMKENELLQSKTVIAGQVFESLQTFKYLGDTKS
jgi:hypothetical protein